MAATEKYFERMKRLGPSTLAVFVALLLVVIAATQPFWSYTQTGVADDEVSVRSYSWGRMTQEEFVQGAWDKTTVVPYTSPTSFDDLRVREVANAFYLVLLVFAAFLFASAIALYGLRKRPGLPLLPVLVLVAALALGSAAVLYAALALPSAAAGDVDSAIRGFWGSGGTAVRTTVWGAGMAWYLALAALALEGIALVLVLFQAGILKAHKE
jgi:hypothetical protein